MTATTALPPTLHVRQLLADLVGQPVTVDPGSPVDLGGPVETGVYVDDRLALVALVVVDLPLAAALGASIALLPRGAVDGAIADRDLGIGLRENLHEVLNVLAALLNGEHLVHTRLHGTHGPGEAPPDVAVHATAVGRRLDLQVGVGRYGGGTLSLVLV